MQKLDRVSSLVFQQPVKEYFDNFIICQMATSENTYQLSLASRLRELKDPETELRKQATF